MCECVFCDSKAFGSHSVITVIREGTEPARKPHSYHSLTHRLAHKHMDSHLLVCSASPWLPEAPSNLREDIRVSSRGGNIRDQSSRDRDRLYRGHRSDSSRGGLTPRANTGFPGAGDMWIIYNVLIIKPHSLQESKLK